MSKLKPKTLEQKERDADRALQKKYGITLQEYYERLAQQGGGCAICKRPPSAKRLHVDHCHKFAKQFKVVRRKLREGFYLAYAQPRDPKGISPYIEFTDRTAKLASDAVKKALKRRSVRGILCSQCNRGLRWYFDRPDLFDSAAKYLRKFAAQPI